MCVFCVCVCVFDALAILFAKLDLRYFQKKILKKYKEMACVEIIHCHSAKVHKL